MATLVGHSWAPLASSKRKSHEDSIEKWWDVNAQPIVSRCMRKYSWKLSFAQRVLKGYRQFMELKTVMNDWKDKQLAPPVAVNMMWEEHVLDSLKYSADCILLFGHTIGHDPDAGLDEQNWVDRIRTTKIAFQARFGADMDHEVWEWGDIEYGINDDNTMEVDYHGHTAAPNSPTGRLPVAQPDHGMNSGHQVTPPRTHLPRPAARHLASVDSDDESAPRKFSRGLTRTPSPSRNTSSRVSPRATSLSPKASTPTGNDPITIFLKDKATGDQTYFSLRYRIPFRVMFAVYAERKHIDQDRLQFTYKGQPLTGFETPFSIGLEEGEHIDVNARR